MSYVENQILTVEYKKADDAPQKRYECIVEKVVPNKMIITRLLGEDGAPTDDYRTFKIEKIVSSVDHGKGTKGYSPEYVKKWPN